MTWSIKSRSLADPEARLLCLHHAGGSPAVFRAWARLLPPSLQVFAAQLPGHGSRVRERPYSELGAMADAVVREVLEQDDRPLAVFGHSMGAWLGLEVVHRLETAGREPLWLFASGRQAPSLGLTQPSIRSLDDEAFLEEMQARHGGIPEAVRRERDLMELLLPALRADIEALETHVPRRNQPVRCPVTALGGHEDGSVPPEHLDDWRLETSGPFEALTFPGGHFYFSDDPRPVLQEVVSRVSGRLGPVGREA